MILSKEVQDLRFNITKNLDLKRQDNKNNINPQGASHYK